MYLILPYNMYNNIMHSEVVSASCQKVCIYEVIIVTCGSLGPLILHHFPVELITRVVPDAFTSSKVKVVNVTIWILAAKWTNDKTENQLATDIWYSEHFFSVKFKFLVPFHRNCNSLYKIKIKLYHFVNYT